MARHAQLKFVMTECSKTQIRLTRPNYDHEQILIQLNTQTLSMLPYGTKAQTLRRSVDLIIGRTALTFSVIYNHQITLTKVVFIRTKIFALKPGVCEMDESCRLQNRLTLLSRIRTCRSKSKTAHKMI